MLFNFTYQDSMLHTQIVGISIVYVIQLHISGFSVSYTNSGYIYSLRYSISHLRMQCSIHKLWVYLQSVLSNFISQATVVLFYILKPVALTEVIHFSNVCYHTAL